MKHSHLFLPVTLFLLFAVFTWSSCELFGNKEEEEPFGFGTIEGTILDRTGHPFSEVSLALALGGNPVTTDTAGHFQLERTPSGARYLILEFPLTYIDSAGQETTRMQRVYKMLAFSVYASQITYLQIKIAVSASGLVPTGGGSCSCYPLCIIVAASDEGEHQLVFQKDDLPDHCREVPRWKIWQPGNSILVPPNNLVNHYIEEAEEGLYALEVTVCDQTEICHLSIP